MSDELLIRKIGHGFDHLDRDGDGRLTEHDHVLMGRSVAASLGHAEGSEAELRVVAAYLTIWRELHLPHLPPGAESVSRAEFIASTRRLADDPAAARATLGALAEAFLAVADTDGDGAVDGEEFFAFQHGHFPGLARQDAAEAFRRLDRDGDGRLSQEEFTGAIVEFWASRDPEAPGTWWTGTTDFAPGPEAA
ncbi:EF-hand domain-containing protein [Streptomyces sp. NPDC001985]|uniref:EF-hand domain-containing protein n=1 Tax=Streptomyces sp. NPDC001985 TaxID=3154406 RepID=UPI003319712C